jgi:hypothetical protein
VRRVRGALDIVAVPDAKIVLQLAYEDRAVFERHVLYFGLCQKFLYSCFVPLAFLFVSPIRWLCPRASAMSCNGAIPILP